MTQTEQKLPIITNIQRYSIHDGPGIRTTVFFKGCPLSCTWCHNPETQDFGPELIWYEDKCTGCMACMQACPAWAVERRDGKAHFSADKCIRCGACAEVCMHTAREMLARREPVERLVNLLARDQAFYEESGGGVTLSGGEAMCQEIGYLEELARRLSKKGISVIVDTCGYAPYDRFERINPYVDGYLYDIKLMDDSLHQKYTGRGNRLILENLCRLNRDRKKLYIRLPLIAGLNDSRADVEAIAAFLKDNRIAVQKLYLLPYHDIGKDKYKRLQRPYGGLSFEPPTKEHMEEMMEQFAQLGFADSQIGG